MKNDLGLKQYLIRGSIGFYIVTNESRKLKGTEAYKNATLIKFSKYRPRKVEKEDKSSNYLHNSLDEINKSSLVLIISKRTHIKLPNISPEVFQVILKYIYGEFLEKVHPYKNLFKRQFYENLLNSHLDPDSEPTENIPLPRNIKIDGIINSNIINNLNIISTISRRIDKMVINNKFDHLRELYLPYKFELLLRGSRDGFYSKKFYELCNGKPYTVTFIKVKGTEEILGGYNPLKWEASNSWIKNRDCFIFSVKNNNAKNVIISNIKNTDRALYYGYSSPYFSDIAMFSSYDNKYISYGRGNYEKKIRDSEGGFYMEDYEVFQIIKR
ncbi:hypothetical protein GLOIN_2v1509986 [Rhizophagus irregularis DAOM 181602=DAOM 197198]|nr:hypothetical protein GLOIN_2v1509986 [Rhizophagus irregularis DAOM 181602=DAOM 197198]